MAAAGLAILAALGFATSAVLARLGMQAPFAVTFTGESLHPLAALGTAGVILVVWGGQL